MRNRRAFQPSVDDIRLEDRQLLSRMSLLPRQPIAVQTAHATSTAARMPVATSAAATRTINALRQALVTYSNQATAALKSIQDGVNRGTIPTTEIGSWLYGPGSRLQAAQSRLQFTLTRAATGLPFGAGMNGFQKPGPNGMPIGGARPSGGSSLLDMLNYSYSMENWTVGPIGTYQQNFYEALSQYDPETDIQSFNLQAGIAALGGKNLDTALAGIATTTRQYILSGVQNRDFSFKS
jgi:hypothetical protein